MHGKPGFMSIPFADSQGRTAAQPNGEQPNPPSRSISQRADGNQWIAQEQLRGASCQRSPAVAAPRTAALASLAIHSAFAAMVTASGSIQCFLSAL